MNPLFRTKSVDRLKADAEASGEGTLKRTLGPLSLVALGIGAIIGAGLFVRTAAAIADRAGPSVTLAFVVVLMLGNLRGIRESGQIFAVPTYFFFTPILGLIAIGAWRVFAGEVPPASPSELTVTAVQPLTLFLLLRAFSNGCTALFTITGPGEGRSCASRSFH